MGIREERLAKWPVEVHVNEFGPLGVMEKFKDVENYVNENGYLINTFYTGHSTTSDELTKLLIKVEKLKIPPGPIAVLPHVHSRIVVFSGEDRSLKAKRAMELARPMQLLRAKNEVFCSSLTTKAILSDDDYSKLEALTRKVRSFIQGFTSIVDEGYEVSRKNNMLTFMALDGVTGLNNFTAMITPEDGQIQLTIRLRKAYEDVKVGTFDPTYENGVNAWKLIQVQVMV